MESTVKVSLPVNGWSITEEDIERWGSGRVELTDESEAKAALVSIQTAVVRLTQAGNGLARRLQELQGD